MTQKQYSEQALKECADASAVKQGKKDEFPFWNTSATQFIYAPSFFFVSLPGISKYRFDAVDEGNGRYSFTADDACASLSPIWQSLKTGVISLTVTALNDDGTDYSVVGGRTFCKMASFPASTPERKCSYRESAARAYKYAFNQSFIQHWLTDGAPDPSYDLNIYPSKIISAMVNAMLSYARIFPEDADKAMTVAVRAADWLIDITHKQTGPLSVIPPTYYFDFCPDPVKYGIVTPNFRQANIYKNTVMMIYPASAGNMYVNMFNSTGERRFLDEAVKIADYYRDTVEENGSWYLVRSVETGLPTANNYIAPMNSVVPFLLNLYNVSGNEEYKLLADNAVKYTEKYQLARYNWEGQFEDTGTSFDYANLTHFDAGRLIWYYSTYRKDDGECIKKAHELMRYIEDQFVVWEKPNPWHIKTQSNQDGATDTPHWHTPAALEQYRWYVPIDSSTASVASYFLSLYKADGNKLNLAKARALTDQLTVVQRENGQIPTHWMGTPSAESNFWFNCMFYSCRVLEEMLEFEDIGL